MNNNSPADASPGDPDPGNATSAVPSAASHFSGGSIASPADTSVDAAADTSTADLSNSIAYVVDDDASVRRLVASVLSGVQIRCDQCETGDEFFSKVTPGQRGCLLLDVDMPGMTGPQVQDALSGKDIHLPVVFLTGAADVATSVAVMRRGAVDLIEKPFDKQRLIDVVTKAMRLDLKLAAVRRRQGIARARYETLNPREREVMGFVVEGLANKQVARKLDLSEKTIEVHRSRVMAKMGADSLAELVRLALDAGVGPEAGGARTANPQ